MKRRITHLDDTAGCAVDCGDNEHGPDEVEDGRSLYAQHLNGWLLNALQLAPGNTVLELAAGTGDFSLRIAERVRPGGVVYCTDRRADAVADALAKARAAEAAEIDARVVDMLNIDLPDASVDAVICRWGLMFAVPTKTALAEVFRVMRPGGRLAIATWGDPERNPWTTLADQAVRQLGLVPPDRQAPGEMLSLADATRLEALLANTGLVSIATAEIPVRWTYADSQAYWLVDVRWRGGPLDRYLAGLSAVEVGRVHSRVNVDLDRFRIGNGELELPGLALCARAQRPS
jgi:SAM-dependent methyltransferase